MRVAIGADHGRFPLKHPIPPPPQGHGQPFTHHREDLLIQRTDGHQVYLT
jgi:hypothetical protein